MKPMRRAARPRSDVGRYDHDTAFWVTKKLYPCRIPYIQTMSPDYIKFFGFPDSGDDRVNQQMREELVSVYLTIGQMADYYSQGDVDIRVSPSLTKELYDRTIAHLQAWKHEIENRLHPGHVPADDLVKLDRFATALFPHAKPFFTTEFQRTHFAQGISSSISRSSIVKRAAPKAQAQEEEKKAGIEHVSYADMFSAQRKDAPSRWK